MMDDDADDTTNNVYVFERIRTAKKTLKHLPTKRRRLINNNKLGTNAKNDNNFSNYDTDYSQTILHHPMGLNFMWIFLKYLLTAFVSTNDNVNVNVNDNENDIEIEIEIEIEMDIDSNQLTDEQIEYSEMNDCDYIDNTNYFTIYDSELTSDEYSQKHKLLRQKFLGKFFTMQFFASHFSLNQFSHHQSKSTYMNENMVASFVVIISHFQIFNSVPMRTMYRYPITTTNF